MSILEDYDHDAAPIAPDDLDLGLDELDSLETQVSQLEELAIVMRNARPNPVTLSVLHSQSLLAGTSFAALGTESLHGDAANALALESIMDAAKEKAGQWSAKIVTLAKRLSTKLVDMTTTAFDYVAKKMKDLGSLVWDQTKAGIAVVRAHPYKTLVALLAAVTAVVAIIAFTSTGLPAEGAAANAFFQFGQRLRSMCAGVKSSFGQISVVGKMKGLAAVPRFIASAGSKIQSGTVEAMGWTASNIRALGTQFLSLGSRIKTAAGALGNKIISPLHNLVSTSKIVPSEIGNLVKAKTGSPIVGYTAEQVARGLYLKVVIVIVSGICKFGAQIIKLASEAFGRVITAMKRVFSGDDHGSAQPA